MFEYGYLVVADDNRRLGAQHLGRCKGKVHQRATLGIGGRRILVSRDWSGKTLADHRADARAWVRNLLGVTTGADDTDPVDQDAAPTYAWELARPDDPDIPPLQHRLLRALSQRAQWKAALLAARDRAATTAPTTVDRPTS
ncbi:hypothetical protein FHX75_14327 [Micromonospora palomenae]|uniref:Uncharacterized protein n=1 Tax=Micromonospora palomenae TaxID=1461247 RepID=A0A561VK40_9ACTN|nr:hypothetical protein FHX75_14327 [Micromonospora palomenae]